MCVTPGIHLMLAKCFLFPYLFHRYVEQSNLMMEKRNNSLQTATENTQARVLHAEQEKVKSLGREKPRSGCVELRSGPVYVITNLLFNRIFALIAKRTRNLPIDFNMSIIQISVR